MFHGEQTNNKEGDMEKREMPSIQNGPVDLLGVKRDCHFKKPQSKFNRKTKKNFQVA